MNRDHIFLCGISRRFIKECVIAFQSYRQDTHGLLVSYMIFGRFSSCAVTRPRIAKKMTYLYVFHLPRLQSQLN